MIYEAAEKRMVWNALIKKEYGMDNIVEYMEMTLESLDALRQHFDNRTELLWELQDYLNF